MHPSAAGSWAPLAAECVGTFVFVLTVCCGSLASPTVPWGTLAVALALVAMTGAASPVSGGHLNPAVSMCLALAGVLQWRTCCSYVVAQLLAGFAAVGCCRVVFLPQRATVEADTTFDLGHVLLAETVYSFMFCLVSSSFHSSTSTKDRNSNTHALTVGLAMMAGGWSTRNMSGTYFNPAVSLGIVVAGSRAPHSLALAAAELLGAGLAAAASRCLLVERLSLDSPCRCALPLAGSANEGPDLSQRFAAEFLGTFLLVLTVGLNVTTSSPASATSAAAALACLVYSLGGLSGGYFNPAVTLGLAAARLDNIPVRDGVAYTVAQITGGCAAGRLYASFHAAGPNSAFTYGLGPGLYYGPAAAGATEMVFTCVLVYTVLVCRSNILVRANNKEFYCGLAIGSCLLSGGIAAGAISGGQFNPAVACGISTASHSHHGSAEPPPFQNCLFFSLWEGAGALLATALFRATHPKLYAESSCC